MHNPDPKKPNEEQEKSTLERVVDAISGFMSTPISDETDEIAKRPAAGETPARAAPAAKPKRRVTRKAAGSRKAAAATKKKRSAGKPGLLGSLRVDDEIVVRDRRGRWGWPERGQRGVELEHV